MAYDAATYGNFEQLWTVAKQPHWLPAMTEMYGMIFRQDRALSILIPFRSAGLAVLDPVYYRHICRYGLYKFERFATRVRDIFTDGKSAEELALAGVEALADSCACVPGSDKVMNHEEILQIFKECNK